MRSPAQRGCVDQGVAEPGLGLQLSFWIQIWCSLPGVAWCGTKTQWPLLLLPRETGPRHSDPSWGLSPGSITRISPSKFLLPTPKGWGFLSCICAPAALAQLFHLPPYFSVFYSVSLPPPHPVISRAQLMSAPDEGTQSNGNASQT